METLSRLIDRRPPVASTTSCQDVWAIFDADHRAFSVAVVDGAAPTGIVYRDVFMGMMAVARDALSQRPIVEVMDRDPRQVPVETELGAFVDRLADSPSPVFRTAFVAVDEAGDYVGVGGLGPLLTSYRRRQREAADAMALVERMATDINHHLDGVLAITARLEQQRLTPDASAFVRAIGETSRDMGAMLGRAIDLHSAAGGQLPMTPTPVRLRDLADAVEARWSARAAEGGSTLLFSYDGEPECGVEVDGERLLQVFDALIESALASGRGVIEACLQARIGADGVHLDGSVRDNAGGLAADRLARIYEPLGAARIEDRTEMALGVGMALAHRIVRGLGGEVMAQANRGAGLTVRFAFDAPTAEIDAAAPAEPTLDTRAAHILIVDDNATNRMVAEALCDMFDCTSEQAVDGVEAVEMARSGRFDLILMDIKMPRMDGVTATRTIREMNGRPAITPIVALTANADPADVQTYLAAGMQDVVEKPIKPERLATVLSALLSGEAEEDVAA
ncbi:response regulator [Caulobacter sp. ErkDOM-E]|uniref:response regulator n=1 Tax=Caulobacter sp. ErkDOM-E TaxID=3402778 RepID=UPI003AF5B323